MTNLHQVVIHVHKKMLHNEILCEKLSLAVVTFYSYYVGQSYNCITVLKEADSFVTSTDK